MFYSEAEFVHITKYLQISWFLSHATTCAENDPPLRLFKQLRTYIIYILLKMFRLYPEMTKHFVMLYKHWAFLGNNKKKKKKKKYVCFFCFFFSINIRAGRSVWRTPIEWAMLGSSICESWRSLFNGKFGCVSTISGDFRCSCSFEETIWLPSFLYMQNRTYTHVDRRYLRICEA